MDVRVQFSCSVVSDSLRPHESQHDRPPCSSQTPGVYSKSCPSSRWCHAAISSSCHSLLLLPPIPPNIRVFSNESALRMRRPKYWSFSFSISPSHEHPGLISFRMNWLDLLAVQGTLKSLLQHHSSKASIFRRSDFFTVQLSHPYINLTSHSRMSGSRWVITPLWLSGLWRSFLYSSSVYSCHLFLISSASVRSIPFLSFIEPIFSWNVPLISLIFLKRSLVFPILLFSSISLHWSLRKAFLSLLAILWNSAFKWEYLSFSPLLLAFLHFTAWNELKFLGMLE